MILSVGMDVVVTTRQTSFEGTIVDLIQAQVEPSEEMLLKYFDDTDLRKINKVSSNYRLVIKKAGKSSHVLVPLVTKNRFGVVVVPK